MAAGTEVEEPGREEVPIYVWFVDAFLCGQYGVQNHVYNSERHERIYMKASVVVRCLDISKNLGRV